MDTLDDFRSITDARDLSDQEAAYWHLKAALAHRTRVHEDAALPGDSGRENDLAAAIRHAEIAQDFCGVVEG